MLGTMQQVIDFPRIACHGPDTLQITPGYERNRSCVQGHVNAGRSRTEQMGPRGDRGSQGSSCAGALG